MDINENKKLSPEKKKKLEALQKMMQNRLTQELEKIIESLKPHKDGLPLADFAQKINMSEGGITTIIASTQSQKKIKIFPVQRGNLQEYYIKLEDKVV